MVTIELEIPEAILKSLPSDDDDAVRDMHLAVERWERRLNELLTDSDNAGPIVDAIDRFEEQWNRYDQYIVELRAWGQSPIYAMAWRDLHEAVVYQLCKHEEFADTIERERNIRIVDNGIRHRN